MKKAQDDVLPFPHFPARHRRRTRTTNCLERLEEEIQHKDPDGEDPLQPKSVHAVYFRSVRGAIGGMGTGKRYLDMIPLGEGTEAERPGRARFASSGMMFIVDERVIALREWRQAPGSNLLPLSSGRYTGEGIHGS